MYDRSAKYYDKIYSFKNYKEETEKLHETIQKHKQSPGNELLDVACGTGNHIEFLKTLYNVEGLDINRQMLSLAKKKYSDVIFHIGDMTRFELKKHFDAITCLFSAIGHLKTRSKLNLAIQNMSRHLRPGGALIIEPWFTPTQWRDGSLHGNFVDEPELKIVRMNISKTRGRLAIMDMHHLVMTPKLIEHFVERLAMGLFTHEEYMASFHHAKLETIFDPVGITGRGLYVGVRHA